jgi:hypothetical protein
VTDSSWPDRLSPGDGSRTGFPTVVFTCTLGDGQRAKNGGHHRPSLEPMERKVLEYFTNIITNWSYSEQVVIGYSQYFSSEVWKLLMSRFCPTSFPVLKVNLTLCLMCGPGGSGGKHAFCASTVDEAMFRCRLWKETIDIVDKVANRNLTALA